jgi:hypothetical protein
MAMGDVRTKVTMAGLPIWPGMWAGLALASDVDRLPDYNVFFQEAVSVIDTACDGFNPPA